MFCMPQEGARVFLYFCDSCEKDSSIHTNKTSVKKVLDTINLHYSGACFKISSGEMGTIRIDLDGNIIEYEHENNLD